MTVKCTLRSTSDYRLDGIGLDSVTYNGRKTPDAHLAMNGDTARQVDELLEKMKHGIDVGDTIFLPLFCTFLRLSTL